ncbi:MAG: NTP transferase domain-containing protein [Polyangia bacterium]
MSQLVVGLFVGGRATRMRGAPKGLLVAPSGVPIVERSAQLAESLGARVVLVGHHAAYAPWSAARGVRTLPDDGTDLGPLGGLLALLRTSKGPTIALACDMPYVTHALVRRLMDAPPAPIVAAKRGGRWEPFFARYDPALVEPLARARADEHATALWQLLDAAGARSLALTADEEAQLRDWDTPEDVTA